jgi:hypothetical protein
MSMHKPHEIWIEQCEAAETIRQRYGLQAAFDYLVGEKLLNFAFAAEQQPTFAHILPRFVARVRDMSTSEQIRTHLGRIEYQRAAAGSRHGGRRRSVRRQSSDRRRAVSPVRHNKGAADRDPAWYILIGPTRMRSCASRRTILSSPSNSGRPMPHQVNPGRGTARHHEPGNPSS